MMPEARRLRNAAGDFSLLYSTPSVITAFSHTSGASVPERLKQIEAWLCQTLDAADFDIRPASADASFRSYWRITHRGSSLIVMDAPPEKEDCRPFVAIARQLEQAGVHVPYIHAMAPELGLLLLEDLGGRHYLDQLDPDSAERLYADAISALIRIQAHADAGALPEYDASLLQQEMALFRHWLLGSHLQLALSATEQQQMHDCFQDLTRVALEQPRVFVHRDYHSRNLMVCTDASPGILDFQDAVRGPCSYDLVSLLRDCYIRWPGPRVRDWALNYLQQAQEAGILPPMPAARFLRWFDLMGIQRHLKASGIFARLCHRDGKPGYLGDIPLTLAYITEVGPQYQETRSLAALVSKRVRPALEQLETS